jgi:glycosyltransferase involved in cell wall biosynthesis
MSLLRGEASNMISVIVTTYNRPDALAAVLTGLDNQTDQNFEIVIADDGSDPDASGLAQRFDAKHVWHPHEGFRAGVIRNRAVEASSGDYIIFLDGDCVPRPSFIARHRDLAESGWFVAGNRVLLTEDATARYLKAGGYIPGGWLAARLRGDINRLLPLLALPLLRKASPAKWKGAKTCNLGVWRHDFDHVGGFDEAYRGWGYEDSDFVIRLIREGVKRKDGRFATGVIHLWHAPNERTSEPENLTRLQQILALASP